jgi:hypothetical protein
MDPFFAHFYPLIDPPYTFPLPTSCKDAVPLTSLTFTIFLSPCLVRFSLLIGSHYCFLPPPPFASSLNPLASHAHLVPLASIPPAHLVPFSFETHSVPPAHLPTLFTDKRLAPPAHLVTLPTSHTSRTFLNKAPLTTQPCPNCILVPFNFLRTLPTLLISFCSLSHPTPTLLHFLSFCSLCRPYHSTLFCS